MNDEEPLLTIGQLADRTQVSVRSIRRWSDTGVIAPVRRSPGGYRLYGPDAVARLGLVRTLRELGLGLEEVRRVLRRESAVADVAARHIAAVDARISALRLNRAVLSVVARRGTTPEETALVNELARLSADERRAAVEGYMREVSDGLRGASGLGDRLGRAPLTLPDDPSAEQVEAWLELAELIRDPDHRARTRRLLERCAPGSTGGALWFTLHVVHAVAEAREGGAEPGGPRAADLLARLFRDADRADVLADLRAGLAADAPRLRRLLSLVRGRRPGPDHGEEYAWLERALEAELRPTPARPAP
ncbi:MULTISPECIES: helix-turn-helix domain-containing protein [Streptomyces]|uniref:helix-turn-helix domain-containing protein n=1 Tax=Streptomyces TaxID=1883 RepID=UPI002F422F49